MSDSSKLYFKQKENVEMLRAINNKLNLYLKDIDKFDYVIGTGERNMLKRIRGKLEEIKSYEED